MICRVSSVLLFLGLSFFFTEMGRSEVDTAGKKAESGPTSDLDVLRPPHGSEILKAFQNEKDVQDYLRRLETDGDRDAQAQYARFLKEGCKSGNCPKEWKVDQLNQRALERAVDAGWSTIHYVDEFHQAVEKFAAKWPEEAESIRKYGEGLGKHRLALGKKSGARKNIKGGIGWFTRNCSNPDKSQPAASCVESKNFRFSCTITAPGQDCPEKGKASLCCYSKREIEGKLANELRHADQEVGFTNVMLSLSQVGLDHPSREKTEHERREAKPRSIDGPPDHQEPARGVRPAARSVH